MNPKSAKQHLAKRRRQKARRAKHARRPPGKRSTTRAPSRGRRALGFCGKTIAFVFVTTFLLVAPWRWIPPPTSAFMLRAALVDGFDVDRSWVPYDQISPHLALCVIASEDQKFPDHSGFDVDQIYKATQENGRTRGASTISQQVAKNLYLWPGRSFVRKGIEAWLTVWIEQLWPKRRILEVYLNTAEFGPGVFGAGAASERFFGKPPSHLELREAATLAAVLPNPKRLSAARPSEYVRGRADEIRRTALALGSRYVAGL